MGAVLGATSVNHASVDVNAYGIAGIDVGVTGALAEITGDADTTASVPLTGQLFDAAGGDVVMTVSADNEAIAKVKRQGGAAIRVSVLTATARIDALTSGTIAAATAASADLRMTADVDNVLATATAESSNLVLTCMVCLLV